MMTEDELLSKLSVHECDFAVADRAIMFNEQTQIAFEEELGTMLLGFDHEDVVEDLGKEVADDIQKHAWAIIKWIQAHGFKVVVYA